MHAVGLCPAAPISQPGPASVSQTRSTPDRVTTYPDRHELPLVAATLEQQFRAIGMDLTINSTNSSEIPAGHQAGTLELGLLARNFALIPDPVGTVLSDYAPGGDWGAMGWENDEIVALAQRLARGEGDNDDRARIAAILQQELPVIPIAWYQQTLAVARGVEGAVIDPWERSFGLARLRFSECTGRKRAGWRRCWRG